MKVKPLNAIDWGTFFEEAGQKIIGAGVDLTVGSTNAASQIAKGVGVGVAGWVQDPNNIGGLINKYTGKKVNSLDELNDDGTIKTNYTPLILGGIAVLGLMFFMKKKK